jgi:hypothetical protein
MLSFAGIGIGTAPFAFPALVSGWAGCILLDFSQTVCILFLDLNLRTDDFDALLVVLAHGVLLFSILLSPSSLLDTTPTSLLLASGITATPVLIQLYSHPLSFDQIPLLATIALGAVSIHLSQPQLITPPQIHRVTHPIATILSSLTTYFTSSLNPLSLLPALLIYYGIFTIPARVPSTNLWIRLRHHPLLKKILHKEDSRKIFTFLCLNLAFMCVQMSYGIYTNSLGLVSDSIHMLVDCAAIAFGLAASVLADDSTESAVDTVQHAHSCTHSHHPSHAHENHDHGHHDHHNHDHDHGHDHHDHSHSHDNHHHHKKAGKWSKLEDLAGFANGIFLVFVCLSILAEALGRLIWPEEVIEVEQLLIVSILGLAVNLVGVFSFNHG